MGCEVEATIDTVRCILLERVNAHLRYERPLDRVKIPRTSMVVDGGCHGGWAGFPLSLDVRLVGVP